MKNTELHEMGLIELNTNELQEIDGGCLFLLIALVAVTAALFAESYYDVL